MIANYKKYKNIAYGSERSHYVAPVCNTNAPGRKPPTPYPESTPSLTTTLPCTLGMNLSASLVCKAIRKLIRMYDFLMTVVFLKCAFLALPSGM